MRRPVPRLLVAAVLLGTACSRETPPPAEPAAAESPPLSDVGADSHAFAVASADGTQIAGQVDRPPGAPDNIPVIVLSAGSGPWDRDERTGRSGTEGDAVFADLARRFAASGIAAVRYDRRGVRYRPADGQVLDPAVSGTSTVETQRDDLGAVYALAKRQFGGESACVALFGHSEGMQHIANLAAAGAPAPALVVGMGAPLYAPAEGFRWQLTERDAFSLRMMDANGDGTVSNWEVRLGWQATPAALFGGPPYHPGGKWTEDALAQLVDTQTALYEEAREKTLAMDPDAPYPNADKPLARYSWWQNWYTDDVPVAEKLAVWDVPMLFYYGDRDSQVRYEFQKPAAAVALGDRAEIHILPGLGHSLGADVLRGPMDEAAADALVARTAALLKQRCGRP